MCLSALKSTAAVFLDYHEHGWHLKHYNIGNSTNKMVSIKSAISMFYHIKKYTSCLSFNDCVNDHVSFRSYDCNSILQTI